MRAYREIKATRRDRPWPWAEIAPGAVQLFMELFSKTIGDALGLPQVAVVVISTGTPTCCATGVQISTSVSGVSMDTTSA